jgi:NDP-sugar pyrophosphorylase family protein
MREGGSPDVVILAGGKGTRLQNVVSDRPKPMAEVAGRPFIEWLILSLKVQGLRRMVLCTGYMHEAIEAYFRDGKRWDVEIVYSRELSPLGTGGALRQALSQVRTDSLLAMNGDSFCHVDVHVLATAHAARRARASLWLVLAEDCRSGGMVEIDEHGAVRAFHEKPSEQQQGLMSAGIYLLERAVVAAIPPDTPVSLETDVLPSLIGHGLYAVIGCGPFLDIGTPDAYEAARHRFPFNIPFLDSHRPWD